MTTSGWAKNEKVIIITTSLFEWRKGLRGFVIIDVLDKLVVDYWNMLDVSHGGEAGPRYRYIYMIFIHP